MATSYVGQILTTGFSFAPINTAQCNGQLVSISQNTALFSVIGTFYGGNGTSTFGLPNLQGRRMNHQGTLSNGGGTYVVGQLAGATSATMTTSTMPTHGHANGAKLASTTAASDVAPAAGSVLGTSADISGHSPLPKPAIYCPSGTAASVALAGLNVAANTGATGSSTPFSIQNPFLVINMVMVLFGVFPSRN